MVRTHDVLARAKARVARTGPQCEHVNTGGDNNINDAPHLESNLWWPSQPLGATNGFVARPRSGEFASLSMCLISLWEGMSCGQISSATCAQMLKGWR